MQAGKLYFSSQGKLLRLILDSEYVLYYYLEINELCCSNYRESVFAQWDELYQFCYT